MDNKDSATERSAEEIAWDEEFRDNKDNGVASVLSDLLVLAVKAPSALIQMPMSLLPEETARHSRAAAREGFLAVRSLLGAIGDGIENLLAEPEGKAGAAVQGPPGTWGTARQKPSASSAASSKVKRIEIGGDAEPPAPVEGVESGEGRGLRADIEY